MAMFVRVKNISPNGPLLTVLDGEAVDVPSGGVIQVTPEQAGRGPQWVPADPDEPRNPVREYRGDGKDLEVHDLGEGLLAQTTNWELVQSETTEGGN